MNDSSAKRLVTRELRDLEILDDDFVRSVFVADNRATSSADEDVADVRVPLSALADLERADEDVARMLDEAGDELVDHDAADLFQAERTWASLLQIGREYVGEASTQDTRERVAKSERRVHRLVERSLGWLVLTWVGDGRAPRSVPAGDRLRGLREALLSTCTTRLHGVAPRAVVQLADVQDLLADGVLAHAADGLEITPELQADVVSARDCLDHLMVDNAAKAVRCWLASGCRRAEVLSVLMAGLLDASVPLATRQEWFARFLEAQDRDAQWSWDDWRLVLARLVVLPEGADIVDPDCWPFDAEPPIWYATVLLESLCSVGIGTWKTPEQLSGSDWIVRCHEQFANAREMKDETVSPVWQALAEYAAWLPGRQGVAV